MSKSKGKYTDKRFNDLSSFLRVFNLYKFKGNFIYNGFDNIEFLILQLFSKFTFNKTILNDYLHIYIEKDKIKILNILYMIKMNIAKEYGLNLQKDEINHILGNTSKNSINYLDSNILSIKSRKNNNEDNWYCSIF